MRRQSRRVPTCTRDPQDDDNICLPQRRPTSKTHVSLGEKSRVVDMQTHPMGTYVYAHVVERDT